MSNDSSASEGELITVVIQARRCEALNIVSFDLVSASQSGLPPFEPGMHVDVHVQPGLIRQYSLLGDWRDEHVYRIAVLEDPASRGGSREIHRSFDVNDAIVIGRPRNNFPLASGATKTVLFGGGIGITPLLSMARYLHASGADFELHYCCRSADRMAFLAEISQADWAGRAHFWLDSDPPADRFDAKSALSGLPPGAHVYVCGPEGFIRYVVETAKSCGLSDEFIHQEHFRRDIELGGESFTVTAKRSGVDVAVMPGQSIAQALIEAGIDVELSCEQGVCGTCLTRVIQGTPDHRDMYQSSEEKERNSHIAICCSRAKTSHLTLDI